MLRRGRKQKRRNRLRRAVFALAGIQPPFTTRHHGEEEAPTGADACGHSTRIPSRVKRRAPVTSVTFNRVRTQGAERGRHSGRKRIPNPLLVVGAGHSQEFGSVGIQATVAGCHGGIQSMTASEGVEFTRSTRSSHAGLNLLAESAHCVTSALSARLDSKTADLPMSCARDAKRYQILATWRPPSLPARVLALG